MVCLVFAFFESLETYFNSAIAKATNDPMSYSLLSFGILSSDILLPVPSSIIMYSNGLVLGITYGFALSFVSSLVSSVLGYIFGGFTNYKKRGQSVKAQKIIDRFGSAAIVLTRGIPILSESISFTAGYNRVNIKNFLLLNCIGYVPICLIYSLFGSWGKENNAFLLSFGLSLIASAIIWFFGRSLLTQSNKSVEE